MYVPAASVARGLVRERAQCSSPGEALRDDVLCLLTLSLSFSTSVLLLTSFSDFSPSDGANEWAGGIVRVR